MTISDPPRSPNRPQRANESGPARMALVLGLLLLGLGLRLIYARGLPLDMDENILLEGAREVSIVPGHFHLPLIGPAARHPGFIVWLIAAANWIARGSLFGIRTVFVLFHVGGLFGLFLLARHLFGYRAGILALAFGAVDRFWVVSSAQLLEPSSFFLLPWILLVAYRCVYSPWRGHAFASWFVLGILLTIANFYYELFILPTFAIGLFLIASPAGRRSLRKAGPYAAAALALGMVALILWWNQKNNQSTLRYAAGVFGTRSLVALSPRILLLYLADAIMPLRDASIMMLSIGTDFFAPFHTPCHWIAGLFYLICVAYSLGSWRDSRTAFLLVCFFSVAAPLSLVPPKELWSNIHYGAQSVIVAMVLSGRIADRLLERRVGRALVAGLLVWLAVSVAFFLHGPKRGYCGPDAEMAFVGQTLYLRWSISDEALARGEDKQATRRRIDEMEKTHPDSLVVQYVRALNAADPEEKIDAMRRAKRIDPHAPVTALLESGILEDSGDLAGARDCLKAALDRNKKVPLLWQNLVQVEYKLGEYEQAAEHAGQIVKESPERAEFHGMLVFIYSALGNAEAERRAFESFRYWCRYPPADAYLWAAREFDNMQEYDRALPYAEKALRLAPQSAQAKFALGVALAGVGDLDRAESLFDDIPPGDPTYAEAKECIEQVRAVKEKARKEGAARLLPSEKGENGHDAP